MGILSLPHTPFTGAGIRPSKTSFNLESSRKGRAVCVGKTNDYDVVIVGAGIIGLSIARQILLLSDLSVAVVDRAVPCSGATGAGQGYIWAVHKSPETPIWNLAMRSRRLWEDFAAGVDDQGFDPLQELGWKKTGSLLVGRTSNESDMLKRRVKQLREAGLIAEFLDGRQLNEAEPELAVWEEGGAAFLPDDYQIDAQSTVSFILNTNRVYASKGRYSEFFHNPVTGLIRSQMSGEIEAVVTDMTTLHVKKAVVLATGCWSGSLMKDLGDSDFCLDFPVKPRKGHLLVMENLWNLNLRHGLMEAGYINHEHVANADDRKTEQMLSISMTATVDASGNVLLGSSRQFAGFSTEPEGSIIKYIWRHAKEFFPKLKKHSLDHPFEGRKVRVGLRPYMPGGKPVIGPLPSFSNVFIAAGHEGEGLSLALGTAEMMADMVLEKPTIVDRAPFSYM